MITPFDEFINDIIAKHYHNHRQQTHSDIVSEGIYRDLLVKCPELKLDIDSGKIMRWLNVKSPTSRGRKMDLLIGEPDSFGKPDLNKVRICIENKSVITAHRNRDARYDDLGEVLGDLHRRRSEIIMIATILVGTAPRFLNIPDGVKSHFKRKMKEFDKNIIPRLSSGDQSLWEEFPEDISENRQKDPEKTISKFRKLPTRELGMTHQVGYDDLLIVPVFIDNVNPPHLVRNNSLGIDIDAMYINMIENICRAYRMRWHPSTI